MTFFKKRLVFSPPRCRMRLKINFKFRHKHDSESYYMSDNCKLRHRKKVLENFQKFISQERYAIILI